MSFYRSKVLLFSALMTGILFDIFIKVDLRHLTFQYGSNTTSNKVLIGLIVTCIVFVWYDFRLESLKSKERTTKALIDLVSDADVPVAVKQRALELLQSK